MNEDIGDPTGTLRNQQHLHCAQAQVSAINNQQSRSQAGSSLIEVLVAVGILAAALMILVTALSTGSFAVRSADTLTTASNLAASQLESLKAQTYDASGVTYTPIAAPPGYAVSIATSVIAAGLQQITVTVTYQGGTLAVSNFKVDR